MGQWTKDARTLEGARFWPYEHTVVKFDEDTLVANIDDLRDYDGTVRVQAPIYQTIRDSVCDSEWSVLPTESHESGSDSPIVLSPPSSVVNVPNPPANAIGVPKEQVDQESANSPKRRKLNDNSDIMTPPQPAQVSQPENAQPAPAAPDADAKNEA